MPSDKLQRFLDGKKENTGRRSEKRTIKRLGGKGTPNSGAASSKGDFKITEEDFLVEAKSTQRQSAPLELAHLLKIRDEATAIGSRPALTFTFTDVEGRPLTGGKFVVLDEMTFQELLENQK